jgi:hypothetical protein
MDESSSSRSLGDSGRTSCVVPAPERSTSYHTFLAFVQQRRAEPDKHFGRASELFANSERAANPLCRSLTTVPRLVASSSQRTTAVTGAVQLATQVCTSSRRSTSRYSPTTSKGRPWPSSPLLRHLPPGRKSHRKRLQLKLRLLLSRPTVSRLSGNQRALQWVRKRSLIKLLSPGSQAYD